MLFLNPLIFSNELEIYDASSLSVPLIESSIAVLCSIIIFQYISKISLLSSSVKARYSCMSATEFVSGWRIAPRVWGRKTNTFIFFFVFVCVFVCAWAKKRTSYFLIFFFFFYFFYKKKKKKKKNVIVLCFGGPDS